jgi:hypothetical protein
MKDPCIIFVGEKPFRVWRSESPFRDGDPLLGMRPDLHVAACEPLKNILAVDPKNDQATLGLRLHYGLAQEAFFALLFAALQAPEVPTTWLLLYTTPDLLGLIERFARGKDLPSVLRCPDPGSWESLAETLVPKCVLDDSTNRRRIRRLGCFWAEWAAEQSNGETRAEFNSLKHGLRLRSASPFLSIAGHQIEGDEHGSWFARAACSGPDVVLRLCGRCWSSPTLLARMHLMALSSRNVLAMLRLLHRAGDTSKLEIEIPEDEELEAATLSGKPLAGFTLGPTWDGGRKPEPFDVAEARRQYDGRSGVPNYDGTLAS